VPFNKRSNHTGLRLLRSRTPHWKVGIEKVEGIPVTNLERTLVDCLIYRRLIGFPIAIESLKMALRQKKTSLQQVAEMAKQMRVYSRIQSVLEVLS
jgi:predicted transcriptional regulator of viral defense system